MLLPCDRIKFDFNTAVARLGFKRRATAVLNSIHKFNYKYIGIHLILKFAKPFLYSSVSFSATAVLFD